MGCGDRARAGGFTARKYHCRVAAVDFLSAMALAFAFSGAVGIFFGFYPARSKQRSSILSRRCGMSDVRDRVPAAPLRSGQRADELDERLLHINAEILAHAFGLSFELGQRSACESCPCGASQGVEYAGNEHVFRMSWRMPYTAARRCTTQGRPRLRGHAGR